MSGTLTCPLCGCPSRRVFEKGKYWICDCEACGHRFAEITDTRGHVERVYGDHYFDGNGHGYHDYFHEEELLTGHGRRYGRILSRYIAPGRVLDVGAAAGFILKGLEEMGWKGEGIEPNARMADYARSCLGVPVKTGTIEEYQLKESYDLISMVQVVAHFIEPRQAFRAAVKLTKPGGFWLIETWDRDSLTARVLGDSWHEYSPPSVLHWFSREQLGRFVGEFGMREVCHGRPMKWIHLSEAKFIAQNHQSEATLWKLFSKAVGLMPDRISLPYLADDLFWALYADLK